MTISLAWNCSDRGTWDALYCRIPRSNILQSWSYGDARLRQGALTACRAMIFDGYQPIGLAQGYERRVAGFAGIIRINRGPLFLARPDTAVLGAVYSSLAAAARPWKPIVISPELEAGNIYPAFMERHGFRRLPPQPWRSALLDLAKPTAEIRASLNRKWRNHLSRAERNGLNISLAHGPDALAWMMERYRQSMTERSYTGIPIPLIGALWIDPQPMFNGMVVRVDGPGGPHAALLIARHGTTATYLAGWIGEQGRQTRAGYLALWSAVEELARGGCNWLDLGGISEAETPGVAQFKSGLGGQNYELAGTYFHL